MRRPGKWQQSKYVVAKNGRLLASRDPAEVSVGSRLIADLTAGWYQLNIKEYARGDLLDLGCGRAPLYSTYRSRVETVTLADWENSYHTNDHLDVVCDITRRLPFDNNKFDTIIFSDVLEHIPNPSSVIGELHRVLRPGGLVIMNVPFMYLVHEAPHDYHRYTEYMLRKIVEENSMTIIKLDVLAGGWAVFLDVFSKLLVGKPKVQNMVQTIGPKILSKRFNERPEMALSYGLIVRKGDK